MNKILLIVIAGLLIPGFAFSQESEGVVSNDQNRSAEEKSSQSAKVLDSEISSFRLDNQFSLKTPVFVDTSTIDFHIYSPMLQQGITNTFLGYLGAPYISNHFFDRIEYQDYYFHTSMNAYRTSQRDVRYYNTTTPFATLKYDQGSGEDEQVFAAFFTQNIDSVTNFGFHFNAIKAAGNYKNQEANHKNLNFFFSRNTQKYNGYASLITATNRVTENGGISDSAVNLARDPFNLLVRLSNGISSEIKTFSLFTSHEYLLGELPFLKQDAETDSLFTPRYAIQYSLEFANYKRTLTEKSVDATYFDTLYFGDVANRYDSSSFQRFTHIIQLRAFENEARKITFGKRVFLENELISAMHPVFDGRRKYTYSNLFLGGEIYNRKNNFLQWSALARFALLGRNIGDAILKATLNKPLYLFGDTLSLYVEGWYQDISPAIFQDHWQDNHFKWENNFTKQHEVVLKARADWDDIHLNTGINYALMSNFLYNGVDALPAQYNGEFSVISLWVNKEFRFGPIRWNNKFIWQESSNNTVIHLPALNGYSSISVNGTLFKVMKYQLGAEVYYHSTFFSDSYEPSTTRFYLQNNMLTGGYPQLNAFVNAKLKRTSAFAQLMHFNSSFSGGSFFSSPFYPINQMAFRFGFCWSFYD